MEYLITYLTIDPEILGEEESVYEAYAIAMSEEEDTKEERFYITAMGVIIPYIKHSLFSAEKEG